MIRMFQCQLPTLGITSFFQAAVLNEGHGTCSKVVGSYYLNQYIQV